MKFILRLLTVISLVFLCLPCRFSFAQVDVEHRLGFDKNKLESNQKALTFHSEKKILAIAYANNSIKLYDVGNSRLIGFIEHKGNVDNLVFDQNAEKLIVVKGKTIFIYDVYAKKLNHVVKMKGSLKVLKSHPKLKHVYINGKNGAIIVLNPKSGKYQLIDNKDLLSVEDIGISKDGKKMAILSMFSPKVVIIDPMTGKVIQSFSRRNADAFVMNIAFSEDGRRVVYSDDKAFHVFNLSTKKTQTVPYRENNSLSSIRLVGDKVMGVSWAGVMQVFDLSADKKRVFTGTDGETKAFAIKKSESFIEQIFQLNDEGVYLINDINNNVNTLYDIGQNKIIGYLYSDANPDFLIATTDGRFNANEPFVDNLYWSSNRDLSHKIGLGSTVDQMYVPNLLYDLAGSITYSIEDIEQYAPEIYFTTSDSLINSSIDHIKLSYNVNSQNGEAVDHVNIFVNGKLIAEGDRGLIMKNNQTSDCIVPLVVGKNKVEIIAVSQRGFFSAPAQVTVIYNGAKKETNLYVLVVGVNEYVNSKYNLNYAVADAASFLKNITESSSKIFKTTDTKLILDKEANKSTIDQAFEEIKQKAQPNDLFVFYYAGHGTVNEQNDFHLVLTDVTQIYGNDSALSQKAISANELRTKCAEIKAQKQLIVLDACHSGEAVNSFHTRGFAEEKAITQLARSTGATLIASTTSEQYATEFEAIGHGVFTYALLEGLNGKADATPKDGKVTVKELESYLNDILPELTQKYKGKHQYPTSWSYGQDFPVKVVGQ